MQEIHISLKIIIHCGYVAPVLFNLIAIYSLLVLITDQDVLHEIEAVLLFTLLNHFNQLASSDYIDTTGDCIGLRHHRFLFKLFNTALLVHLDRTVAFYIGILVHVLTYYCDVCFLFDMILQHFVVIHFVDTVAGSNHNIRFMTVF